MAINKKLIHFENFSNFNSKKLSANKENTAYTIGVDGTVTTGDPEILYQSICWIKDTKQQWTHGQLYDCSGNESIGSTTALSGKINLTSIDEIKAAQSALSQTNDVAFYLVTDSSGKIPSSQGCYDIPSDIVKQLSLTSPNSITNDVLALATSSVSINAVGVNVGDLVALTRVKFKVSDLTAALGINLSLSGEIEIYQYKILSMNDAKPTGHWEASAGVMGLMSPWDKGQVNKISGIESTANNALPKTDRLPTNSGNEFNMDECLQNGIYPWCATGRPAGSVGHYSLIVHRSSTADFNGFYTIEQTAYGREAELGQVYKRIIFEKTDGSDTQFGEWVKVSNDNNGEFNTHCAIVKSEDYVQIENPSLGFGMSAMCVDATDSPYAVPSFSTGSVILVMDIDYTYGIDVESSTIVSKIPTKSQVYATKEELNNISGSLNTYTFNIDTNSFPFEYTITQEEYDKILNADLLLLVNNEKSYQSANKEFINDSLTINFRDINIGSTTTEINIHVSYEYDGNGVKTFNVFVNKETIDAYGVITDIVNEVSNYTSSVYGLCETDLIDGAVITLDFGNLWDSLYKPYMLYIQTPTDIYTLFGPTISIDSETSFMTLKFKNDYDDKTIICTIKQYENIGTISNIEIGAGGDLSGYATKEELNNKQDKLENGVNIKTINGLSLLGSGVLTISGNAAYPQINHGTSNTTCMLQPNLFYVWDTVTELNLAFDEGDANEANEYLFLFTSGETATTLFVPDDIKWTDGFIIIDANKIYQISILNGLGTVMSWDI